MSAAVPSPLPVSPALPPVCHVAVNDYVWTAEDPLPESAASSNDALREGPPHPEGETSTHVVVHTLYLSGQGQRYRHFLRQSNGAIVEDSLSRLPVTQPAVRTDAQDGGGDSSPDQY
ncbi:unnamed protein product [Pleuronectes platessa]|uniref:Uncharacterized protein n=1 Tax=Pleuronectes platessa TaxID=8262 RepID=A0A9N7VNS0_PLEPL|nr:unnamed protein product [Pleuronectes platessa]